MEVTVARRKNLSQRLDEIDEGIYKQAYNGFYQSRVAILIGQWDKGEAVSGEFTGVKSPTYRELEEQTGRDHKSLKKWHTLYLKHPDREAYRIIAEEKARDWTVRALTGSKIKLELPQSQPAKIESGQMRTIIIDPPWPYGTQYDPDTRRVASPYPEMTLEAITATEFPFADDCVLWLWTTHKFMKAGFDILDAWNFDYKAILVWDKQALGIGYWLRMQCEFCLLAIKGNPEWKATDIRDIISEQRREHSRKPESFYKIVVETCPQPIGEAFAREEREGIEVITGNERNKFTV